MQIIQDKISLAELKQISQKMFGDLVKAVVDVEKGIMVVDADMHADEEKMLLEQGSKQENLWGINLYPEFFDTENLIEYDSIINIRPWQGNRSRGVDNGDVRKKIAKVVDRLIETGLTRLNLK